MGLDALLPANSLKVLVSAGVLDESAGSELGSLTAVETGRLFEHQQTLMAAGRPADARNPTAEEVEVLHAAAAVVGNIRSELDRRLQTRESREKAVDELSRRLAAEGEKAIAAAAQLDGPASRGRLPSIARLAARQPGRTRPLARPAARGGPKALTAGGAPVADLHQAAESAASMIQREVANRHGWAGRELRVLVSSAADYPEERQLGRDENANEAKLQAVVSQEALTASGGVCGPVGVDYSMTTIASDDRPVRDTALAQFQAARGGIRYVLPHTLAQITGDGPAAIWTQATDVSPGGSTKPHATFVCQAVQEAYVDAVTSIVQFGNFQSRYFPEQVMQYMSGAEAVHSRLAESTLLAAISAGSTQVTADNNEIGAARDLLSTMDRASANYRYAHRLAAATPLRLILPDYVRHMLRADLTRNMPGDSGTAAERLAASDAEIAAFFSVRGINVTWTPDSFSGASILQGFPAQGNGQLAPWPATTYGFLFHEGAWLFLDGGTLSLGMVRDSVLNKTNDFQMFSETFEKAVFKGHGSWQLAMKIAPTGASVGTVAPVSGGTETIGS